MPTRDQQLADVDARLKTARLDLRTAQARCQRSPNGETIALVLICIADLDQLLDERLAIQHQPATAGR
jgi:hypothetical protein